MSIVIFTSSSSAPVVESDVDQWVSLRHTWTGWDGSVWDLTGDEVSTSGVALLAGVRGLGTPDETDYWIEGPGVPGARWVDSIAEKREVFWPIEVYQNGSSSEWINYDRALFRTFNRRKPGVWSVLNPATSEIRTLRLRFKDDGQFAADVDPSIMGYVQYALTFTAEQPYWQGATIHRSWGQGETPQNFFGGGDVNAAGPGGPPFYISQGSSLNTATISNPGDVDAYPTWTVRGPSTNATVGLGDRLIEVPVTLAAGEWVQINSLAQTVLYGSGVVDPSTGTKRIPDGLGTVEFAEIPPGENVPLTLTMTGTGNIDMDLTPFYNRAW